MPAAMAWPVQPTTTGIGDSKTFRANSNPARTRSPPVVGVAAHGREIESGGQASISAENQGNPVSGHGEIECLRQRRQELFGKGVDLAVVDPNGRDRIGFFEQHV